MGPEAWRVVWGPLMEGKFAGRSEEISAAWLHNKLNLRRRIDGREAGGERLGYPRGGWQPLLDRLADEITRAGGTVLIDRPARALRRASMTAGSSSAWGAAGRSGRAPTPAPSRRTAQPPTRRCSRPCPRRSSARCSTRGSRQRSGRTTPGACGAAEYGTAICLLLELDRRFGDFYWTNIAEPGIPFIGLIEQGNLARHGALRRPALPLRRQLRAAGRRADRRSRRRAAARSTSRTCARSNPAFERTGSGTAPYARPRHSRS